MDIGTGIAIAGVWVFVGLGFASSSISNMGSWVSLLVGVVITIFLK